MLKYYKNSLDFFMRNKKILFIVFLCLFFNAPLKWIQWTFLGAYFFIMFFVTGFLGMVYNERKDGSVKVGIRAFIVECGYKFSYVAMNFMEVGLTFILNFIMIIFWGIMPFMMMKMKTTENTSMMLFFVMAGMVLLYRFPLLVTFYFPAVINKESGQYAIAKVKEVLWEKPIIFLHLYLQLAVYLAILMIKFIFNVQKNLVMFQILDVLGAALFLFFIIADFYFYLDIVENNEKYQEKYSKATYKGRFKGILGRFLF